MKTLIRKSAPWVALASIIAGIFLMLANVTPMIHIASGSMEPTLPTGSRILIHEQNSYEIGDIITFYADEGKVETHRLVEFGEDGTLITKGDANPTPDVWDEPVTESDVMGKTVALITLTTPHFWTSRVGLGFILCLAVVALALWWKPEDDENDVSESDRETVSTSSPA